jgi:choline dehydrogenase
MLKVAPANTQEPAPLHIAFLEAAASLGLPFLEDPDDPTRPTGAARIPVSLVDDTRWNTAFAYLDPARGRPNLTVRGNTLVDRIVLDGARATGVVTASGERIDADVVVLTAGAYFTPAILLRSGIGPEPEMARHDIPLLVKLPVGEVLRDHHGTGISWQPTDLLNRMTTDNVRRAGALYEPHAVVKAASSACDAGSWDLHLISWTNESGVRDRYEASVAVFHMKPGSAGRLRLRSREPRDLPEVERGFFHDPSDLPTIVEGMEIARALANQPPLARLLSREVAPADEPLERYARRTARNYFHPVGTCGIGRVVDDSGRVLGVDGLVVADASIMPTIPRANTNLTTVGIAERLAEAI